MSNKTQTKSSIAKAKAIVHFDNRTGLADAINDAHDANRKNSKATDDQQQEDESVKTVKQKGKAQAKAKATKKQQQEDESVETVKQKGKLQTKAKATKKRQREDESEEPEKTKKDKPQPKAKASKKRQQEEDESVVTDKQKDKAQTKAKDAARAQKRRKTTHNDSEGEQEQQEVDHEIEQVQEEVPEEEENEEDKTDVNIEDEGSEVDGDDEEEGSEGDTEHYKTTVKTVKLLKKAKRARLESKVKDVTISPVQHTIDTIEEKIIKATMGYALMNVMDDQDLGCGPTTIAQAINIRPIDVGFLKQFAADTAKQGLQNCQAVNAIYVGVKRSWVVEDSLEPLKADKYMNHVRWTDEVKQGQAKMLLYNGNHRRMYMRTFGRSVTAYQQYQKAKTELPDAKDAEIRAVLEDGIKKAEKILKEHGCWVVKFFDLDMVNEPEYRSLIEHTLASNTPLPTKVDNDDDKLAQIVMILNRIRSAERPAYIKELLKKSGLKSRESKIPQILNNTSLYEAVMTFTRIPHFRSSRTGTGLSCRQVGAWLDLTGGLQLYGAEYMTEVLCFLSTPMKVNSIEKAVAIAAKMNKEEHQLKTQAAKHLEETMKTHESIFSMFSFVGKYYLEEWASIWIKISSSMFDLFGADRQDPQEKEDCARYTDAMDKYWRRVASHAEAMARDVKADDTDAASVIRRYMAVKIAWLRSGYMFALYHPAIRCELPIANKYLFAQMQELWHSKGKNSVSVHDALMEIIGWIEPFAILAIKQRGTRIWPDFTSALRDHLVKRLGFDDKQIGTIFGLLINRRRTTLRVMQTCLLQLRKECKVNITAETKHLTEKTFLDFMNNIIKVYKAEVVKWQKENMFDNNSIDCHEPRARPAPSNDVIDDLGTEGLSKIQKKVAKEILYMLQVTAIDWVNTKQLKGIKQVIQAVAPGLLRRSHTREILASSSGWALREELRNLLSVNMAGEQWFWWDAIDTQPKTARPNNIAIDEEVMVSKMAGETAGNASARTLQVPQHREYNQGVMQKIINLAMDPRLGAINEYSDHVTTSPEMLKALKRFMEAMAVESERHIARIEDPEMDKTGTSRSNYGNVKQLLTDYALIWPTEESEEGCAEFFGSIECKEVQEMTSAALHEDQPSKKMWEETKKRKEEEKKKIAKEKMTISKVLLFGKAGRIARATKRMQEMSLDEEAARIANFDLENDVEMQDATKGTKSKATDSMLDDNMNEHGNESSSSESAPAQSDNGDENDVHTKDVDMDTDQEGQVSKDKGKGKAAAEENVSSQSHYDTDPGMLEAMANIHPRMLCSPAKQVSVNMDTIREYADVDMTTDNEGRQAGPSGKKLFLSSDNEESIMDWPISDKEEEDMIEDPPLVASSNARETTDLFRSDDDCDTIDKAEELKLAQVLQKKSQKTFYTWSNYCEAINEKRMPNSCMEKVPAVLRILSDLWRIAKTTKGKHYRKAVSEFIFWLNGHSAQPSLFEVSDAVELFPSKPTTQGTIDTAKDWISASVSMHGVMLKDIKRLYDGSLLKEVVAAKNEVQKHGLQRT